MVITAALKPTNLCVYPHTLLVDVATREEVMATHAQLESSWSDTNTTARTARLFAMPFELGEDEARILRKTLEGRLSELREEIVTTEKHEWRVASTTRPCLAAWAKRTRSSST